MLSISLSDMKLITELSGMSEFDMIRIENDDLMAKYLYKIGCDVPDYPWIYIPSKHRNLQNQVVTGYRAVAEIRCDADFRDSYLAGITERLTIASYFDSSCMEEIASLSYQVRDFAEHLNDSDSIEFDEDRALFPADQLEPNWEMEEAKIKELQDILDEIRGPAYNSAGSLKTSEEYRQWFENKEFYNEKYDV